MDLLLPWPSMTLVSRRIRDDIDVINNSQYNIDTFYLREYVKGV